MTLINIWSLGNKDHLNPNSLFILKSLNLNLVGNIARKKELNAINQILRDINMKLNIFDHYKSNFTISFSICLTIEYKRSVISIMFSCTSSDFNITHHLFQAVKAKTVFHEGKRGEFIGTNNLNISKAKCYLQFVSPTSLDFYFCSPMVLKG